MESVKRVSAFVVVSRMFDNIRNSAATRLRQYCVDRVIALGLATMSSKNTELYLGNAGTASRKTIGKLRTMLQKYLLKNMPYLDSIEGGFLQLHDREYFKIMLYSIPEVRTIPLLLNRTRQTSNYEVNSSSALRRAALDKIGDHKWSERYCRYMNYLCRKYRVPLKLSPSTTLDFEPTDVGAAGMLPTEAERHSYPIRSKLSTRILITVGAWYNDNLYSGFEVPPNISDADLANPRGWEFSQIIGMGENRFSMLADFNPYQIFLHLENCIRVLQTLTRKVSYGYSAYSFRSI